MDTAVSRTDDDALAARASAVKLGYWADDHIRYFVKTVERKAPVINRGTYVRTYAIDRIVEHFLQGSTSTKKKKQIVSLGAGSDTRFYNLALPYVKAGTEVAFRYHEIDFPHVCQRKALTMSSKKGLKDILYHGETSPLVDGRRGSIYSETYSLHPLDLQDIHRDKLPGIDPDLETLIISEVCLIYMDVEAADRVLAWTRMFHKAAVLIYEPIRGDDAFGKMMIRNLAARGLELKTLEKYSTLELQRQRLTDAGFTTAKACTMSHVFENWASVTERERISKLEMLDELEEWTLLADHYCISVGWKGLDENSGLPQYLL